MSNILDFEIFLKELSSALQTDVAQSHNLLSLSNFNPENSVLPRSNSHSECKIYELLRELFLQSSISQSDKDICNTYIQHLLRSLSHSARLCASTIWKLGCQLFLDGDSDATQKNQELDALLLSAQNLVLDSSEIAMDSAVGMLYAGHPDFENIASRLITIRAHNRSKSESEAYNPQKLAYFKNSCQILAGICFYIGWRASVRELTGLLSNDPAAPIVDSEYDVLAEKAQRLSRSAISCFEYFADVPGSWDLVIFLHTEVLRTTDTPDAVIEMLERHITTNPDHVFPYIVTYEFKRLINQNEAELLQKLVQLDPWNIDYALELVKRQSDNNDVFPALKILFNLLDCASCEKPHAVWSALAGVLVKTIEDKESHRSVKSVWRAHYDYWLLWHFKEFSSESSAPDLLRELSLWLSDYNHNYSDNEEESLSKLKHLCYLILESICPLRDGFLLQSTSSLEQ